MALRLAVVMCVLAMASAVHPQWLPNHKELSSDVLGSEQFAAMSQMRRLAVEFFDFYPNVTLKDLLPGAEHGQRLPTAQDLECLADFTLWLNDLSSFKTWALKMIDAWGSLPSGTLVGNMWDLGHFDECLNIDKAITGGHSIKGKYCFAKVKPAPTIAKAIILKTAVCFPASCSAAHMDTMLRRLFKQLLNVELSSELQIVDEATCQTAEQEPYDGLTIFTIVVLSILAALVALATLWDYFLSGNGRLPPLVKGFSARSNSRTLFKLVEPKSNPNVIDCLHGIRALSFIWVVFGHDYIVYASSPNINLYDVLTWTKSVFSFLVTHGIYAVDTFFFLSGLLLVVISLRSMDRTKGKLNIPMMYLHRYIRLTPILAMGILMYLCILPLLAQGPLHGVLGFDDYGKCKESWYLTLLYVQNYIGVDRLCISHSWYLAVDMQLYIFAPFLLIALYKWGKKAAAGIFILMMLLVCCLFSIMVINDLSLGNTADGMRRLYYATNTRASPYLIGILFGYFLHLNRGRQFKLTWIWVLLGWLVSLALLFTCVFATYGRDSVTIVEEAFFVSLARVAWPLALCWVVFACMHGYGYVADSFLSSPLWQPISRLSYAAYIFHMFIESLNGGVGRTSTYFSDYQVMMRFWADFGFTLFLAYLMNILVEAPFASLVNVLLPTKRPSPSPGPKSPIPVEPQTKEATIEAPAPTID
ncbi:hypothetical protein KR009_012229, partial [Drosophila setifemur]